MRCIYKVLFTRVHPEAEKVNTLGKCSPRCSPFGNLRLKVLVYFMSYEADVLNVAMFGMTAKQWRDLNPEKNGNIRDYATVNELICLSNMENLNAVFIDQGMPQGERLVKLNQIAIQQMRVLEDDGDDRKYLK